MKKSRYWLWTLSAVVSVVAVTLLMVLTFVEVGSVSSLEKLPIVSAANSHLRTFPLRGEVAYCYRRHFRPYVVAVSEATESEFLAWTKENSNRFSEYTLNEEFAWPQLLSKSVPPIVESYPSFGEKGDRIVATWLQRDGVNVTLELNASTGVLLVGVSRHGGP